MSRLRGLLHIRPAVGEDGVACPGPVAQPMERSKELGDNILFTCQCNKPVNPEQDEDTAASLSIYEICSFIFFATTAPIFGTLASLSTEAADSLSKVVYPAL